MNKRQKKSASSAEKGFPVIWKITPTAPDIMFRLLRMRKPIRIFRL